MMLVRLLMHLGGEQQVVQRDHLLFGSLLLLGVLVLMTAAVALQMRMMRMMATFRS